MHNSFLLLLMHTSTFLEYPLPWGYSKRAAMSDDALEAAVLDTSEAAVPQDALVALVNRLLEVGDNGEEDEEDEEGSDNGSAEEDSLLIDAARSGRTSEVTALLAEGDAVDQTNRDGSTPLILASEFGCTETVSVLCSAGAAVDLANNGGDTALILACEEGHTETASVLVSAGATVDKSDNIGRTPLFLAIDNGHLAIAQLLISRGASRTISVLGQERTAVGRATRGGHADLAAWLTISEHWTTPLHHLSTMDAACARAHLRDVGANLHAAAVKGGPTPLSLAREIMLAAGDAATRDDGSAAALVLQAARPWSRDTHALFPAAARARATELLIAGHRLSREPRFAPGAMALFDVWVGCVMPHAVRREEE